MYEDLTPKQINFLKYLKKKIDGKGYAPSLRKAAADLDISHAAVAQFIRSLESKGYLRRDGHYSRTIYLLSRTSQMAATLRWREVPIIGKVTAGLPMYAQHDWNGTIIVDGNIYKGHNLFALRLKGDSMKDIGMLSDDLVICEPRQYAQNGEIVVALINNEEATVKRFFLCKDHIELCPENKAYTLMRYGFGEVLIQGKVIGVQRGPDQLS
ncbi:MAG: repressor LexA [Desulfobacteraceae bacterium]|nr:repressor LexA [Desulfobacteraceae bacterium]MBC2719030.1 repressor LexA [Desulfobacteraceae bacterium]